MKSTVQLSPTKHLDNISKMFRKLYTDEQLTDCTLCCKDGSIKAHKIILASSSPYFHKIFTENNRDNPIVVMHGVSYQHLHDLIELIYKGNVEVLAESLNPLYELAGEFQLTGISGILREEHGDKIDSPDSHNRDTRYKGLKRVAVDYIESDPKVSRQENSSSPQNKEPLLIPTKEVTIEEDLEQEKETKEETPTPENVDNGNKEEKLTAWAKKQRKFQCDLCPSSFKRSSHLTRHQLVHTGERPYACNQCDKAFSRHDKLKHHIRKTHEEAYEDYEYNTPEYEADYTLETVNQMPVNPSPPPPPPPFVISNVRTEPDNNGESPIKRPRGRPRKYPIVVKPQVKRGRGRPRLNQQKFDTPNGENYDITNLPFGDLEYLTMPLQQTDHESVIIEPFVEIKTDGDKEAANQEDKKKGEEDKEEKKKVTSEAHQSSQKEEKTKAVEEVVKKKSSPEPGSSNNQEVEQDLKIFENKLAKIGECTISIANQ